MGHTLDPSDPRSPASPFAPAQPAQGVVADDVDEKGQNLAGGPTASQASAENVDNFVGSEPVAANEAVVPQKDEQQSGSSSASSNRPSSAAAKSDPSK